MGGPANNGHAILSPSGASRWLACTPSARLEEQYPDTTSEAAEEGTLAHELGETILLHHVGEINKRTFTRRVNKIKKNPLYNAEMQNHAENYASYVIERFEEAKKRSSDAVLQIEAKLNLTDYIPEGFGTGDGVIIADGILDIIDLKYGKGVLVSCENNKQMMIYALGALFEFGFMYDIDLVRMNIYQPRLDNISSFEMPVNELLEWATTELKPKANLAFEGKGEFVAGPHCQFCKARVQCRALAESNLELAKYEFASSDLLSDSEIAEILSKADQFKKWISSIERFALSEAVDNGKKWDGFKLVEGRSNRTYVDQDAVAKRLVEQGIPEELIYSKSLLGITAMEKVITKKEFTNLLSDLVVKPQGKPTLAPLSDKRPEWNSVESAITDFSDN